MARPTKAKAMERLQKALDAIPELRQKAESSPEFKVWRNRTETAVEEVFDRDSSRYKLFTRDLVASLLHEGHQGGLRFADLSLASMIEEIEENWEDDKPIAVSLLEEYRAREEAEAAKELKAYRKDERETPTSSAARGNERTNTNEVFVIHGRDEGTRAMVARFLEQLNLKPVILDEQSNQGLTIIEKFERHAQVGFAVALLTPDDVGALQDSRDDLKPRARQNVVFELGYFFGQLGRERVCALMKGNVEIPSDYSGVVYIPLDDGGWKMKLIEELKKAGFDVDTNKAR